MASIALISMAQVSAIPQQIISKPVVGLQEASTQLSPADNIVSKAVEQSATEVPPVSAMTEQAELSYKVDKELKMIITQFKNAQGKVIQQLPPEQIVNMYRIFSRLNKKNEITTLNLEV